MFGTNPFTIYLKYPLILYFRTYTLLCRFNLGFVPGVVITIEYWTLVTRTGPAIRRGHLDGWRDSTPTLTSHLAPRTSFTSSISPPTTSSLLCGHEYLNSTNLCIFTSPWRHFLIQHGCQPVTAVRCRHTGEAYRTLASTPHQRRYSNEREGRVSLC